MKHERKIRSIGSGASANGLLRVAVTSCLLLSAPHVLAQAVSATLRGQVTADSVPASGATVTATNTLDRTQPHRAIQCEWQLHCGWTASRSVQGRRECRRQDLIAGRRAAVGQTATLDLGVGADAGAELESVTVSATRLSKRRPPRSPTTSRCKEIELLPQSSRNFLEFADTDAGHAVRSRRQRLNRIAQRRSIGQWRERVTSTASARRTTYRAAVSADRQLADSAASNRGRAAIHSRSSPSASTRSSRRTTRPSSTR